MLGTRQVFIHAYIPYLMQDFIGKGGLGELGTGRRTILKSIFQKHVVKVSMIPNSITSASKRELCDDDWRFLGFHTDQYFRHEWMPGAETILFTMASILARQIAHIGICSLSAHHTIPRLGEIILWWCVLHQDNSTFLSIMSGQAIP